MKREPRKWLRMASNSGSGASNHEGRLGGGLQQRFCVEIGDWRANIALKSSLSTKTVATGIVRYRESESAIHGPRRRLEVVQVGRKSVMHGG